MSKKKIIIISIGVVIAIAIAATFIIINVVSYPGCSNQVLNMATSKDGKYAANLYSRECGATTDDYTNIDIVKNDALKSTKNIFRVKGYNTHITMNWDGNNLNVAYPDSSAPVLSINNWDNITIMYKAIKSNCK